MIISHGQNILELCRFGAMITKVEFNLGGRRIRPMFENPWRHDQRPIDRFVRQLGAEWVCVPFGLAMAPAHLPRNWQIARSISNWNDRVHGYGAHCDWQLEYDGPSAAIGTIEYPAQSPVAQLTRRIELGAERIAFVLSVRARRQAQIGIGIHPIFQLKGTPSRYARLVVNDDTVWSFPVDVEPNRSRFKPDQRETRLSAIHGIDGKTLDATRLPLDSQTEDLLLLTRTDGKVTLERPDQGYRASVVWNSADLPSCALWYSNGGRKYPPWDERVMALGIEPVCAAFNLGEPHNLSNLTPLAKNGIRTAIAITPEKEWATRYSIVVEPCGVSARQGVMH